MEDEDIGLCELLRGRKLISATGLGAAFVEEFRPVPEECGMVVAAGAVGLLAGADEDAKGLCGGSDLPAEEE